MPDFDESSVPDTFEADDIPEIVDYETLQYNRTYFNCKDQDERRSKSSRTTTRQATQSKNKTRMSTNLEIMNLSFKANAELESLPVGEEHATGSTEENTHSTRSPEKSRRDSTRPKSQRNTEWSKSSLLPASQSSRQLGGVDTLQVRYSVSELVETIGSQQEVSKLTPELQRRVLDFDLAQKKRLERFGQQKRWGKFNESFYESDCEFTFSMYILISVLPCSTGIFGLYAYLSDIRIDLEWAEDAAWRRNNSQPYLSWTDFEKVHNKGKNRPWFTYFLLFICSIMMLVEFGLGDWKIAPLSENPMIGPSAQALIDAGARVTPLIVDAGQWFRIFSPLFLHAGLIHFFLNMGALWFVGAAVEQSHGIINAMILFFVPGVGGNILSAIFLPQYISVGASGGIFGLIGGCVADIMMHWSILFMKTNKEDTDTSARRQNQAAVAWLIFDIVINLCIGFTPYVDNYCHLAGFVYGIACGWSAIEPLAVRFFGVRDTKAVRIMKIAARFCGLIFSVVMIMVTTGVLASMSSDSTPCSKCRYVSCIPFPPFREEKWWYCDDCAFVTGTLYKDNDGDAMYTTLELTCPNKAVESIPINTTDRQAIIHDLPSYCREWCDEVYA